MGLIRVPVTIRALRGSRRARREALVDTGASLTVIPREVARQVGIATSGPVSVKLAGGPRGTMETGSAFIRVDGREAPCTVLVAPGGDILLGAETLELLGVTVDIKRKRLKLGPHSALMVA